MTEPNAKDAWWLTGEAVEEKLGTGMLVALVGQHGGGKTTLASAIINIACWRWMSCRLVTATSLGMGLAQARRDEGGGEEGYVEDMRDIDLLVIDEWQDRSGTEHEDKIVKELINQRYGHQKDTLIVSNLQHEKFIRDIGPSVADRMNECGGIFLCDWPSRRVASK